MCYLNLSTLLTDGKVVSHMHFIYYSVYLILIPLAQCKIWVQTGQKTCQKSQLFYENRVTSV